MLQGPWGDVDLSFQGSKHHCFQYRYLQNHWITCRIYFFPGTESNQVVCCNTQQMAQSYNLKYGICCLVSPKGPQKCCRHFWVADSLWHSNVSFTLEGMKCKEYYLKLSLKKMYWGNYCTLNICVLIIPPNFWVLYVTKASKDLATHSSPDIISKILST